VLPPPEPSRRRLRQFATALITETRPDVLLVFSGTEFLALGGAGIPPAVADRIDCHTLTTWRGLRGAGPRRLAAGASDLLATARYERRLVRGLAATVVVGPDDARLLRRLSGSDRVHVIPNGVAVAAPAPASAEAPEPTVTFTGVLCYPPNVDAALHLVKDVWPKVRAAVPAARLVLAGRAPSPEVLALSTHPGVSVLADLPDLRPVLASAWVCVAPMRSGAGIKNKVLEAWAIGRPVVLTSLAANGLALDDAARTLLADGAEALAARIVVLLGDDARRRAAGDAGRRLALGAHGWPAATESLEALLTRAIRSRPPPL
jgi:glycosyltransferase involved in cell wall biosynthesis